MSSILRDLITQYLSDISVVGGETIQQATQRGNRIKNNYRDIYDEIATRIDNADSNILTAIAGENLSGGKIVYLLDNKIYTYSPNNTSLYGAPIGITMGAASENSTVEVQVSGIFTETGLGLVPNINYYAGINGLLTANPDNLTIVQSIGRSVTSDKIYINIQTPIITI